MSLLLFFCIYVYNIIGLIVIEKNNNNRLLNTQMPKLRFCIDKRTQHMDTHTYVRTYVHTYIKEVRMCVCFVHVYNVEVMLTLYIRNNTYVPCYSKSTYMYVCICIYVQPSCSSDKPIIQRSMRLSMLNTCTVASSC